VIRAPIRPVVLLDLLPINTSREQNFLGVLAMFWRTRRLDMVLVELDRVGRQDVRAPFIALTVGM